METTHIDTVSADTIEVGDLVEHWVEDDSEEGRYTIESVTDVVDAGEHIEIYTEETEEGFALNPNTQVRLFLYVYE